MTLILDGSAGVTFPNSTVQASSSVVLQVVSAITTSSTTTTSSSFVATALTASITPKYSTSKIYVVAVGNLDCAIAGVQIAATLYRNSTNLSTTSGSNAFGLAYADASRLQTPLTMAVLDSPATTSSTTYTVYVARALGSGSALFNNGNALASGSNTATMTLLEIAA
jgi:hypothetical protein